MATLTSHSPSLSPTSSRPFMSASIRRTRSPRLSTSPTVSSTSSSQSLPQPKTSAPSAADNSSARAQNHAQRRTTHNSASVSEALTSVKSRPQMSANFNDTQVQPDNTAPEVTASSQIQPQATSSFQDTTFTARADRGTQYTPPLYPPTYRYSPSKTFNPPSYSNFSAQRRRERSNSSEETDASARQGIATATLDDTNAPKQATARQSDRGHLDSSAGQASGSVSTTNRPTPNLMSAEGTRSHKPSATTDGSTDSPDEDSSSGSGSSSAPSAKSPQPPQAQRTTSLSQASGKSGSVIEGSAAKRARADAPSAKELPRDYWECDVTDLGILISDMLLDLVRINDKIPLKDGQLTRFHSRAPPAISVRDYLNRLIVHATLIPPILLSMVYYIDRLCALYPAFTISSLTVHRFLISAATVAAKGLSDSFWTNNTYARVGGVSVKELALLELEFLEKMEWRIVPPHEVLIDYYRSLVERNAAYRFLG